MQLRNDGLIKPSKIREPHMKNIPELAWVAVAVFGGIAKALSDFIKSGSTSFSIANLIANAIVGGFSGYISAQAAYILYPDWAVVAAGVGGAMGVQAFDVLIALLKRKFNLVFNLSDRNMFNLSNRSVFYLSNRSLSRLNGVEAPLVKVVKRAIELTKVDFLVLEGRRTVERQRMLVKTGASRTMNSRHLTGHAVDLGAWVQGEVSFHWPHYYAIADAMKQAASELNIPIEWGGDWKSFKDGPHYQLPRDKYP